MRVLVVDDHEIVRRGICSVIATDPTLLVCGEAVNGKDAVDKAMALRPDVVVMDITMPRMNGLEATRQIKSALPEVRIVIVSQHDLPEMVRQAINAGASAYVSKSSISTELLAAIAKIFRHEPMAEIVHLADTSPNLDPHEILQRSVAFERAVRESDERFRSAMNNMAEGVYTIDTQGLVTYINPSAEAMFGWTAAELLEKKMHDITHHTHPDGTPFPASDCAGLQVLQKGIDLREYEDTFIRKDGSFFPVIFNSSPLRIDGTQVGLVVSFHDDTRRRRSIQQAQESERLRGLLAAIVDCSDDAIISKTLDGLITSWNKSAERLFGYTEREAIGQDIGLIVPSDRRDEEAGLVERLRRGERLEHFETIRQRKDGTRLDVSLTLSPIKNGEGKVVGASKVARDITERKQPERELRESEERFRAIVETTPECVKLVAIEGTLLHMNSSGLTMVGADCAEMVVGKSVYDIIAPHDRDRYRAFNEGVCRGEKGALEFDIVGLRGVGRRMETHAAPFRLPNGAVVQLAITRDITERSRVERELKTREEQLRTLAEELETQVRARTEELEQRNSEILRQSEQLRELSNRLLQTQDEERRRIARELHDGVGQLLAALGMNLSNLTGEKHKLSLTGSQSLEENVSLIEQASQEIRTMSHLLHPPLLDEMGLESALSWFVDGFSERSKIAVVLQLAPGFSKGLPRELALSLFRIVQECLTNVHRHSESLTALVKIERTSHEISLEIKDEGRGISPEIQAKISSGESSGVGLRGMRERVWQFGGRLEIRSTPKGTWITAILPLSQLDSTNDAIEFDEANDDGDKSVAGSSPEEPGHDSATILCIDDETTGLLPRRLLLESAGHRVIEAQSGEEGIRLFQSEKVDAVILDYWMSGMKGTAVAMELRRINPSVPIVVLSGVSDLPGEAAGLVDQWLVKGTHRAEKLLDSISTLLERRPA